MTTASLEALCSQISSGGTPSRKKPDYFTTEGGHLWVKSQELRDRPIYGTDEKISDEGLANSSAKYYEPSTILVAMYGATVGKLAILRARATVNQAICALCVDPEVADHRFVYYSLLATRDDLARQAAGAAQQNLNQGLIKRFSIPVLPLEEQRTVGSVLARFDDLIENNRRRISIVTEIARLLYREWFVDLRFPGHRREGMNSDGAEALPPGWEAKPLGDFASYINRGVSPTYDDESQSVVLNQRCVRDHQVGLDNSRRHVTSVPKEKYVQLGDVLVNSTGVGTLGRTAPVRTPLEDTTVDSHVTIVRPSPTSNVDYFAELLLTLEPLFESMGTGSTGQTELARARIAEIPVTVAPAQLQDRFGQIARPMRRLSAGLVQQNQTLRAMRDSLLPRLVSGDLKSAGLKVDLREPVPA
jgi:type I restriction enzyme S subunit